MSSLKGKADLWRAGKNGASPGTREKLPGGGKDFQAPANFRGQYRGDHKIGGGGANSPSSADNLGVFANSIAGLSIKDKPFLPNPGSGRDGLDMYAVKSNAKETDFGLDVGKAPPKKMPGEF
jgi:hypothetical protein